MSAPPSVLESSLAISWGRQILPIWYYRQIGHSLLKPELDSGIWLELKPLRFTIHLGSDTEGTINLSALPPLPPPPMKVSFGWSNSCEHFLSRGRECPWYCTSVWRPGMNLLPSQTIVTYTLEVVISSLSVFKETLPVDHIVLRWTWRSL